MKPVLCAVVAVADNGVIGRDGDLPWRLSSDLKMFRRLTMGKPIIMGRRTWQSLQRQPLDGRDNIVVTGDRSFAAQGAHIVHSPEAAVAMACEFAQKREVDEIMVIGGAELYRALLSDVRRIYLTRVHAEPEGDAFFPPLDEDQWRIVAHEPIVRGDRDEYDASLSVLERA